MKKNDRFVRMISRLFSLLISTFLFSVVNAQEGFKIGPQVTFLSSRAHVTDTVFDNFNFRFKSGARIGLTAQYGFTPKFVLASGVNFTSKGYRVFNDTNNRGNILKHNMSHLEIPLNMIFKFRMGASSRMRFLLGTSLNYQLSNKEKVLMNEGESFIIKEDHVSKIYPLANLGVEIASESKSGNIFVFGVYYSQSFTNQTKLNIHSALNQTKELFSFGYRGSYAGIGISYLFDLKNFKREEEFFY